MRVEECITAVRTVAAGDSTADWDAVIVDRAIKDRLLHHTLLAMELRRSVRATTSALHGLLLAVGPPGTGKTTLMRGLPAVVASYVGQKKVRFVDVNPHGLMSAEHGQSQQQVVELLSEYIPVLAEDGLPTLVLLDEVESMAVARSEASLAANPADVHRATDAVLTALDRNATQCPHLVTLATSNFVGALDAAFVSRADVVIEVSLPGLEARAAIVAATLRGFSESYPALARVADDQRGILRVAKACDGLDGRQVRKLITEAMAENLTTVLDPGALDIDTVRSVAERTAAERGDLITTAKSTTHREGSGHAAA